MKIEKKIKEIVGRVLEKNGFTLHNIFLFDSRARGDFDEESDYDILIILNEEISIENKWMTPYTETPYSFRKRGQFSTGINNNSFS